jgi:serine/threonine protein kinase
MFRTSDYLSELLIEGPPADRCTLVRALPSDDFGPRVLAKRRGDDRPIVVRGMAIADAAWARALRRLEAIAGVKGEHVAPLVAYGRHEGLAYFVHEHDGGPRLTSFLEERGGRLPLSVLLPVFAQLLVAVGAAHRQGVVVGGVRPQDVRIVAKEGGAVRVRLLDLGFASVLGVPMGRRGAVDHPAIYRAPEPDVAADPASDVFSLGVLFVRMLTGPLPRSASEVERTELLRARLAQAHRDDPGFSDGLFTLLSEVVDPDLATRPRDAQRLLEALLEVVPASTLRLPNPSASRWQPYVAEDGAPVWPARQWTVLQSWAEPRRPTPAPARVAAAAARAANEAPAPATDAAASSVAPVLPLVPRPAPRRRGLVSRVALAAAFLSTGTALGLAIAVGEPGATAAPAAAAARSTSVEASAAAPQSSTLVVQTTPPGMLTIDGQRRGPTPYQGTLSPGAHVVRVEAPGHQAWRARVELAPGQARHVEVALEPAGGPTEVARSGVVAP